VENYFQYFTEIEEHFQRRRGGALLLSTLDWALIETWKDAGIPLEAVLRGIDATFERYERRGRMRKINSLAYCSQEVLAATAAMKEAALGTARPEAKEAGPAAAEIADYLLRNAGKLEQAALPSSAVASPQVVACEAAQTLRELTQATPPRLEDLERHLTVLEEKLFAVLLAVTADHDLVQMRADADRELAPYRRKMPGAQIEQLQKQFVQKRLLEKYGLPRLSLFYM
jgi:hypothetical protein